MMPTSSYHYEEGKVSQIVLLVMSGYTPKSGKGL